MSASDDVQDARNHLAAGHPRRSLSAAWRAADAALREGNASTLQSVMAIAEELQRNSEKRVATDAQRLASYCQHALDGAGGGVESHSILSRISRMRKPRKACPDCAEQIPAEARVCRYCGYRFPTQ